MANLDSNLSLQQNRGEAPGTTIVVDHVLRSDFYTAWQPRSRSLVAGRSDDVTAAQLPTRSTWTFPGSLPPRAETTRAACRASGLLTRVPISGYLKQASCANRTQDPAVDSDRATGPCAAIGSAAVAVRVGKLDVGNNHTGPTFHGQGGDHGLARSQMADALMWLSSHIHRTNRFHASNVDYL